jgi:tyrosinase
MMAAPDYLSDPILTPAPEQAAIFARAELVFYGVDHSGPSFEARVFVDNENATPETPEEDPSYVGSFRIFGHGGCFGEEGHCDVPRGPQDAFDLRLPHQQLPHTKTVGITEFLRERLLQHDSAPMTVKVVLVARGWPSDQEGATGNLLSFERLALVTYD